LRFKANPGKQFRDPISRKTYHKNRAGGVACGKGPKFKPHTAKKKKKSPKTLRAHGFQ
jgi:hypothetical protein